MNLPDNIKEAFENGRLTTQSPIKYQIFQILQKGKPREHVLVPSAAEPFNSVEEAHLMVAKLIDRKKVKRVTFTILPIITA